MRVDFSSAFLNAIQKPDNEPVTLTQVDWPAIGALPALTLRMTDRGSSADGSKLPIGGIDWFNVIESMGDIDRMVSPDQISANSDADVNVSIVNVETEMFSPPKPLSHIFKDYPPEAAIVTLYQWVEGAGLSAADMAKKFVGSMADPVEFDDRVLSADLVELSAAYGDRMIGKLVNLTDFPDAPPESVGKPVNIVIGPVPKVPALRVTNIGESRLRTAYVPTDSTMRLMDASSFPPAGTVIIDSDEIAYTGRAGNDLTGCSGADSIHYSGGGVIEKSVEHKFCVFDSGYPHSALNDVYLLDRDGKAHLADAEDYSKDLVNGLIIFNRRPQFKAGGDTKFRQAHFDAVDASNTAANAANAMSADGGQGTTPATISQTNRILALKQTDVTPDLGEIAKVMVQVAHFAEEKIPNDTLTVEIPGIGQVGTLSKPAAEDQALNVGSIDMTHDHLDSFQFPTVDPTHFHTPTAPLTVVQAATGGVLGLGEQVQSADGFPYQFTFPGYSGTATKVVYTITVKIIGWNSTIDPGLSGQVAEMYLKAPGSAGALKTFFKIIADFGAVVYRELNQSLELNDVTNTIQLSTDGSKFNFLDFECASAVREVTISPAPAVDAKSTSVTTAKSGDVTQYSATPPLVNTTEKTSNLVNDFIDITAHVTGWDWFTDRVVQVKYNGSSDGRAVYITLMRFEIEFAALQTEYSDKVVVDTDGVKDDDGLVTGTIGTLIARPDHVKKWSVLKGIGLTAAAIDDDSFFAAGEQYDAAFAGGYKLTGIIQKSKVKDLWREWEANCRSFFYWDLGKAKIHYRPVNDAGRSPAIVRDIPDSMIRASSGRPLIKCERTRTSNIINSIDLRYDRRWHENGYDSIVPKSDGGSVSKYGKKEKPDLFEFNWTRNPDQAVDLVDFSIAQHREANDLLRVELMLDNMDLERGDGVRISPPTHNDTLIPAVVLGPDRNIGNGKRQKADSVPVFLQLLAGLPPPLLDPADLVLDTGSPAVLLSGAVLSPVPADLVLDIAGPSVVLGSMTVIPVSADLVLDAVDPFVAANLFDQYPGLFDDAAGLFDGNLKIVPSPADLVLDAVDPAVWAGTFDQHPGLFDDAAGLFDDA